MFLSTLNIDPNIVVHEFNILKVLLKGCSFKNF